jgi:hypothetical protein
LNPSRSRETVKTLLPSASCSTQRSLRFSVPEAGPALAPYLPLGYPKRVPRKIRYARPVACQGLAACRPSAVCPRAWPILSPTHRKIALIKLVRFVNPFFTATGVFWCCRVLRPRAPQTRPVFPRREAPADAPKRRILKGCGLWKSLTPVRSGCSPSFSPSPSLSGCFGAFGGTRDARTGYINPALQGHGFSRAV